VTVRRQHIFSSFRVLRCYRGHKSLILLMEFGNTKPLFLGRHLRWVLPGKGLINQWFIDGGNTVTPENAKDSVTRNGGVR
jgi:hypothetical protein